MNTAIIKALEERQRQINEEGFIADRDDEYVSGELAEAAICYTEAVREQANGVDPTRLKLAEPINWPDNWDFNKWWKPSEDPKRNIIKAMALLSAEYDRIERAEAAAMPAPAPETIYSTDDEWQACIYEDLQELIEDREREAGDVVYMGTKQPMQATMFTTLLSETVIENMQVQAEDDLNDAADGYPDTTKEQNSVLQALIDAWAANYCTPDFYIIANVSDYTITERDVQPIQQDNQL